MSLSLEEKARRVLAHNIDPIAADGAAGERRSFHVSSYPVTPTFQLALLPTSLPSPSHSDTTIPLSSAISIDTFLSTLYSYLFFCSLIF